MSVSRNGHEVSLETRAKISAARTGMVFSEEHKEKLRQRRWKMSDTTKQKMSKAHLGHIVTEETRMKIGAANKKH